MNFYDVSDSPCTRTLKKQVNGYRLDYVDNRWLLSNVVLSERIQNVCSVHYKM